MAYIRVPFADSGDKAAIPVASQPDGSVSFVQGYPLAYSLDPLTDTGAKRIERLKMNQLFYDITRAVQEIQQNGVKPFITSEENGGSAFSYGAGALVMYNGAIYQSLVSANTALPTVATNWAPLSNSANAVPVINPAIASDLNLITITGIYSTTAAAANSPLPQTAVLEHYERAQGSARVQIWHCVSSSASVANLHFVRIGTGTAGSVVWSGWKQLATTADVALRALLNGDVANDFAVRNSGELNNAVSNARLNFVLGGYASLNGNAAQAFAMSNSGVGSNGVNNDRLNSVLLGYAFKGGDAAQAFAMANSGNGPAGVNNDRLNFVLQSYAAVGGNQFTPFSVGGATAATQAVRLDQFQSGNNGNGAWVKLPGGGMWARQNLTLAANGTTQWNFPATFPSAPAVFITAINGPFQCWLIGVGPNNCSIFNNGQALNVNLLAIY